MDSKLLVKAERNFYGKSLCGDIESFKVKKSLLENKKS